MLRRLPCWFLVLVVFAPTLEGRISSAIFTLTAVMLFGTSAVYHRGNWSPKAQAALRRMDHANIFLIIAGTYTPLTVMLLDGRTRVVVLVVVLVVVSSSEPHAASTMTAVRYPSFIEILLQYLFH